MIKKILQGTTVLYHVTDEGNTGSISQNGVSPAYSMGKKQVSWYVSRQKIEWAILHVAVRHRLYVQDIVICAVLVDWPNVKRSGQVGLYYVNYPLFPESFAAAEKFMSYDEEEFENEQE